jgi:hypothetical protein
MPSSIAPHGLIWAFRDPFRVLARRRRERLQHAIIGVYASAVNADYNVRSRTLTRAIRKECDWP